MKDSGLIVIYGSYGFTGRLIADVCRARNLNVMLAGRNESHLRRQQQSTGYPYTCLTLDEKEKLHALLSPAVVVIHCGGPFQQTAVGMAEACLQTKTHYIDIAGEYRVFEMLATLDDRAKANGIQILGGGGFDVVPTDCLALHLKERLPDATHLQLAFSMGKGGGLSRGTARTSIEGLGEGSVVREGGVLKNIPLGERNIEVDFGTFNSLATAIPWGDIATAFRSTDIPNIEVYMAMPRKRIRQLRFVKYANWLLRKPAIKKWLRKQIDKRGDGPSPERLATARSSIWGRVTNESGEQRISTLETPGGYTLTAATSVSIAENILNGNFRAGYQTPSLAYGSAFITAIPGVILTDR